MTKYYVTLRVLENQADSFSTATHTINAESAHKAEEMAITSSKNRCRWGCIVDKVISIKPVTA